MIIGFTSGDAVGDVGVGLGAGVDGVGAGLDAHAGNIASSNVKAITIIAPDITLRHSLVVILSSFFGLFGIMLPMPSILNPQRTTSLYLYFSNILNKI